MNLNDNTKTLFKDASGNFRDLLDEKGQPLTYRDLILTALRKRTEEADAKEDTVTARFELMEKVSEAENEIEFSQLEKAEIRKCAAGVFDAMVFGCLVRELK